MKNKDIKNGDFVLYTRGDKHVVLYVEFYNESDDIWLGTDSDGEDYFFEASDIDPYWPYPIRNEDIIIV